VKARQAVIVAVTALPLLMGATGGCGTTTGGSSSSGGPPLGGNSPGGGICYRFRPGQTFTDSEIADVNNSSAPVTITSAWLTGMRDMKVDAVYADAFTVGSQGPASHADWNGWPPASLRHPASGVTVPAGNAVTVMFVVTATSPAAFFAGQDFSYRSEGQAYTQVDPLYLGPGPNC
jgi:hypothetical protein